MTFSLFILFHIFRRTVFSI